ncbi:MAG: ribokinase, partial [Blautia sp.]|nr:ribokinase [Blautia sp.]
MKVLNFGSLNVDNVYSVDHMVIGGETINSCRLEQFCGGKGL